ncbi:39S ribosomal protein L17, mitochondrial [Halotydeus destructor]|nr:39S ribosomal protein L17, mitochondrial [Halotydeus destructor]
MTSLRRIRNYISHVHQARDWRFWHPHYPTTSTKKLIPALNADVPVGLKPRRANTLWVKGVEGRLEILSWRMTDLVKNERIELMYHQADELRPYAERLIIEAMKHGDRHRATMELADFWLKEKQLIHKLFKVLVPRYIDYKTSFTSIHKLSPKYEDNAATDVRAYVRYRAHRELAVIELKGNPFPPLRQRIASNNKNFLSNVLLDAARREFEAKKDKKPIVSESP